MKDEALRLALEALESHIVWFSRDTMIGKAMRKKAEDSIAAIKLALEQPEPEPVAWMYQDKSTHEVQFQKNMRSFVDHSRTSEVPLYGEPLSNHELQCVCGAVWCGDEMVHLPNKTSPCQPLTDDEFISMVDSAGLVVDPTLAFEIKEMVEDAHGIKE